MSKRVSKEKMAILAKLSNMIAMRARNDLGCAEERSNTIGQDIEDLRAVRRSIAEADSEIPMMPAMAAGERLIRAKERHLLQDHARAEVVRLEATAFARVAEQKRLLLASVIRQAS